jgi:hypothetical protein
MGWGVKAFNRKGREGCAKDAKKIKKINDFLSSGRKQNGI